MSRPHMSLASRDSTKEARDLARTIRLNPNKEISVTTRKPTNDELKAIADDGAATDTDKKARKTKGADGEALAELLKKTGLTLTRKSADHWHGPGGEKGPRLVVPRGKSVTRVYGYKLTGGPGFKTEDERKAEGLGAVTNVLPVSSVDDVKPLIQTVVEAVDPPKSKGKPAEEARVAADAPSSSRKAAKRSTKGTKGEKKPANQTLVLTSFEKAEPGAEEE